MTNRSIRKELRGWLMNPQAHAVLDGREIFDPSELDDAPMEMLIEGINPDAIEGDGDVEDVTVLYGRIAPRAPWEMIP